MRKIKSEADAERRAARVGAFLEALGDGLGVTGLEGGGLTSIQIRLPTEADPSVLLVLKATSGEGKRIAFVGALRISGAILAWRAKDAEGSLRWREDLPWSERG